MIKFPAEIERAAQTFPYMVGYESWLKLISESAGSNMMKARVVNIAKHARNGSYLNCLKLGWVMGALEDGLKSEAEMADFLTTIHETRDLNKLPYVKIGDEPVS